MSVSVSTTAGNQVTVIVDGATQLSFTTQESSISVVNGDTSSISVTNQGPKGDVGPQGPQGETGPGVTGNELENVVEDTTPQLGGDLDVNGNKIVSASNGDIVIDPNGTGAIIFKSDDIQFDGDGGFGTGKIKFYESDVIGSNFVALAAPLSVTSDITLNLPDGVGTNGQVLKTNGLNPATLSWTDVLSDTNPDFVGYLDIRPAGSFPATLFFYDIDGSNYVSLKAPDIVSSDVAFVLPGADGSAGQVLKTDGSGNLSFVDQTSDTNTNIYDTDGALTGDRTIDLGSNDLTFDGVGGATGVASISSVGDGTFRRGLTVQGTASTPGTLQLRELSGNGTNQVSLSAPDNLAANASFTLPGADGSAGQVIKTDGSGNLSFTDQPSDPLIVLANISGRYQWANSDDAERVWTGSTAYGPFNWYNFTNEPSQTTIKNYSGSEVVGSTSQGINNYEFFAYGIKNPYTGKKVRVDYSFRVFGSGGSTPNASPTNFGFSVWSGDAGTSGTTNASNITYRGESGDEAVTTSSLNHYHGSFTTSASVEDDYIFVLAEHRDSTGLNRSNTFMYANIAVYMID